MTRTSARLSLLVVAIVFLSSALPNPSPAQTVSFIARADLEVGTNPRSVAVGDFNGDGRLDLAVTNASSYDVPGTVGVVLGNGDRACRSAVSFAAGAPA